MKEVCTWRNAVVEINRAIRSGRPACMWVKKHNQWVLCEYGGGTI